MLGMISLMCLLLIDIVNLFSPARNCRHACGRGESRSSPVTLPRLDRGTLFLTAKRDRPVKPGEGEH